MGLALIIGWPIVTAVRAADHGQMGATFPIIENDLLTMIETRLRHLEANGQIDVLQRQMQEQAVASVRRPKPVEGLTPAMARREWLYDPSIITEEDIVDAKGNVITPAGTRINPLDLVEMRQELVFVDGSTAQIDWAVRTYSDARAKIVFVAGSPFDAMKPWQRRFYFDQGGKLTGKFGIRHTPAIVSGAIVTKSGKALKVSEVPLSRQGGAS